MADLPEPAPPVPGPASGAEPLYGEEFTRDPAAVYERLWRRHGAFAPVMLEPGVRGWLALTYDAVAAVCRNPSTWSHDARRWADWSQGRVPEDSELLPMMTYRANLLFADGNEHARLRRAVVDSLGRVDPQVLEAEIHRLAGQLVDDFAESGAADLVGQYARLLPLLVFNRLFGLADAEGFRLLEVLRRIVFGSDADRASEDLARYMSDLVTAKRRAPGEDITTWLMGHRAELGDEELVHQLMLIIAAGNAPTADLTANALRMVLTERGAGPSGIDQSVEEAVDRVLWRETPVQNYPFVYPRHDVPVGEHTTIPAGCPVGLGLAAANQSIVREYDDRLRSGGNRGYLSFGVGDHRCPAQDMARQIAVIGVQTALARLPGLRLAPDAGEPVRRTSVFARALTALPVVFQPQPRATPAPDRAPVPRTRAGHGEAPRRTSWWRSVGRWLSGH
ncbi:MAG TPA: cytochrome P450 [Streptosporangiaceae bacterium]|jgi:cytochrome P450